MTEPIKKETIDEFTLLHNKEKNKAKLESRTLTNAQRLEESKYKIAHWFIIGYISLLLFIFIIPLGIFLSSSNFTLESLEKVVNLYNGVLASLTGMLGFVIGYYFNNK